MTASMRGHTARTGASVVAVLALALGLLLAAPASAGTGDNYPAQWKNVPLGAHVDEWGYYSRYCTSWVAWALRDRNGFEMPRAIGHARDWGPNARARGFAVDKTPAPGAVAWWDANAPGSGGWGHVAWVQKVNGNGTVTIEEYNNPAGSGRYNVRDVPTGSVSGYIHFKDLPAPKPPNPPFGYFDRIERAPGGAQVQAWAIDPDAGTRPINMDFFAADGAAEPGRPTVRILANGDRQDVGRVYPQYGAAHGASGFWRLEHGAHTVCAYAVNQGAGPARHKISCKKLTVSPHPFGVLDSAKPVAGGVEVSGWAIDGDTRLSLGVHVYGGDGRSTQPNRMTALTASADRPDVARSYRHFGPAHGFKGFVPLAAGTHTVCAYGLNASGTPGANQKLTGCKTVTVG